MPREDKALPEEAECIDRITVKDGTHIHLIRTDELLYIQACGDYVTLVTPSGQYVKEQTMKYFDAHLPSAGFVRVHRSAAVKRDGEISQGRTLLEKKIISSR